MVLLGGIYHQKTQTTIETLVRSHLSLVGKQVKIQVDRYISTQQDRINLISSRTQLRHSLKSLIEGESPEANRQKIRKILSDAQKTVLDVTSLLIYGENNELVFSTAPHQDPDLTDRLPSFQNAGLNHVYVVKRGNTTRLKIASPLKLNGDDLGTIVMELDSSGLEQSLFSENSEMRPEKAIIFHKDASGLYEPILNYQNISYNGLKFNNLIRSLSDSEQDTVINLSQSGKRYLGYLKPLNFDRWGILLIIDTEIALKALSDQNTFLFNSISLILFLLLVLSLVLGNRISRPIVDMAYVARLIAGGNFSKRIRSYSNDEIGILANTLNEMAEKLISANRELDKKVKEKTLDLRVANEQLIQLNQEIKEQSKIDALTRVKNRRAFDEYLEQEVKRANRDGLPISLLLMDVDHFKKYNDCLGHQKGDDCLIQVAQCIQHCVRRESDLVARYGGEEFAVILPNTDQASALAIAQQILLELKIVKLQHPDSPTSDHVTISIGVVSDQGDFSQPLDTTLLVGMADTALYKAKEQGRDQAVAL